MGGRAATRITLQSTPLFRTIACYVDTRFVVQTSNMCERLFFCCRLRPERSAQAHTTYEFEAQIFFHENREMWSISDVDRITKSNYDNLE